MRHFFLLIFFSCCYSLSNFPYTKSKFLDKKLQCFSNENKDAVDQIIFSKKFTSKEIFDLLFFETLSSSKFLSEKIKKKSKKKKKKKKTQKIIIFIHGTVSYPERYTDYEKKKSLKGLYRKLSEQLNTEKSIKDNYENNFFKRKNRGSLFEEDKLPLLMGTEPGLHKIEKSNVTEIAYQNIYEKLNGKNRIYYMFNWDGDLSKKSRIFFGKMLGEKINQLRLSDTDKVDLYCYSHGGNLALIAATHTKVNDIYLLGTPIGKTTEKIISNIPQENYNHIYNIYAINDTVQIKDPFFDLGYLPGRAIKELNQKIYNIEIKLEDKTKDIKHEDFFIFNKEKPYSPLIVPLQNFREKFMLFSDQKQNKKINNYIVTLKEDNQTLESYPNTKSIENLFFRRYF